MNNLGFGLAITAVGMGTVFILLLILMAVLMLIGWSDKPTRTASGASPPAGTSQPDVVPGPDVLTEEELAAITVAVITHARVRRMQAAPAMRVFEPGSHLFASRWVGIGRSYQQQPWRRDN